VPSNLLSYCITTLFVCQEAIFFTTSQGYRPPDLPTFLVGVVSVFYCGSCLYHLPETFSSLDFLFIVSRFYSFVKGQFSFSLTNQEFGLSVFAKSSELVAFSPTRFQHSAVPVPYFTVLIVACFFMFVYSTELLFFHIQIQRTKSADYIELLAD
jgi:hypothetical protein